MRYETPGSGTSTVEVTNVSTHGLWLLINEHEVFLPFHKFPWFQDAPIGKVVHVELPSAQHLYWPELDVDLEVESVLHPERYPLVSRVHEAGERYEPAGHTSEFDQDKIDESVLALLRLTLHDGVWAWKGQDFEVMNRLFEKGYILDPRNKTKSVMVTEKGLARSKELFEEMFGKKRCGGN
jgi:Domain of unknown function (DUF6429)/Protein of unknown function (DUF2442)